MKSFNRRLPDHFIDEKGNNLFELALKESLNNPIIKGTVIGYTLDNKKPVECIYNNGGFARYGHIGVEYHNRYCFYYYDYKGRHFLCHYIDDEIKCNGIRFYTKERNAVLEALKNCGIIA